MGFFIHNGQRLHTSFLSEAVEAPAMALKLINDNFWYLCSTSETVAEAVQGEKEQDQPEDEVDHLKDSPLNEHGHYKVDHEQDDDKDQNGDQ